MERINRREFLSKSLAAAGTVAASSSLIAATKNSNKNNNANVNMNMKRELKISSATDLVALGKTGIKVSFLGMGSGSTGWNYSSNQTRLGQKKFTEIVRHALDNGITFLDAADMYGSHTFYREALKGVPRERYALQSKIINRTAEEARKDLDRFLKELGVEYIDTVLIHVVTQPTWVSDYKGVRDVLSEAKEKGKIRAHGVSCHTISSLRAAAASDWVEVDLARINHKGVSMDAEPEVVAPVLRQMCESGKGVIAMKVFGNGDFRNLDERTTSLRYIISQNCVDTMVIGFESREEIDEAVKNIGLALG